MSATIQIVASDPNDLTRSVDIESIGPELLTVGMLQIYVHVSTRRPCQQVYQTARGARGHIKVYESVGGV